MNNNHSKHLISLDMLYNTRFKKSRLTWYWLACILITLTGNSLLAQDYIELDQPVTDNLEVTARVMVSMVPGFNTAPGITFSAYIEEESIPDNIPQELSDVNVMGTPDEGMNYIRTISYREETTSGDLSNKHLENIQYFDGLGRLKQTINVNASPLGNDIVLPVYYDDYGREKNKYLPFVTDGDGAFQDNAYGRALEYYRATSAPLGKEPDYNANINFEFDNSPLNRVVSEKGPGEAWKYYSGNPLLYKYKTNLLPLTYWVPNGTSLDFAPRTLFVIEIIDEQGNVTREYKSKQGLVIQKEALDAETIHRTVYVYDEFDRLRTVVPPKADNPSDSGYCYYYTYDKRGRMIEKKLPGAERVYLFYDERDRLVLTQDGKTRAENEDLYYFTKYDVFNRPVMTGKVEISETRDDIRNILEDEDGRLLFEQYNGSSTCYGYTFYRTYPDIEAGDVFTVTYYDDYSFISDNGQLNALEYAHFSPDGSGYNSVASIKTKGLTTGTITKVLNIEEMDYTPADDELYSVLYYDDYGNVTRSISENHLGGHDVVFTAYEPITFEVDITEQQHKIGTETFSLVQYFYYDHTGRLLETRCRHKMPGETEQKTLNAMRYNELGELVEKYLHSNSITGSKNFLQKIDYRYNIRGWLTAVNNPDLSEDNDLFGMKLYYTNADEFNNNPPDNCFNGNIAAMEWKTKDYNKRRGYGFTYDGLNRLITADYSDGDALDEHGGYFSMGISNYDKNGNIKHLTRKYNNVLVDTLTYNYIGNNSNQLKNIIDNGFEDSGVDDYVVQETGDYVYDDNGNMTTDPGKSIDSIAYNYLNLPQTLSHNNGQIHYLYDAAGTKRTKLVSDGVNTISTTHYCGNIVYENGVIAYILIGEGRLVPEETAQGTHWKHEYFLKDHLGNTRVTFTEGGSGLAEIVQSSSYYPFGLAFAKYNATADPDYTKNRYLYNGKELQDDLLGTESLNWYDYGARMYDPALGRWHVPDPKAEEYFDWTPYNYALNNPIRFIDPDGKAPQDQNPIGQKLSTNPSSKVIQKTVAQAQTSANIKIAATKKLVAVHYGGNYEGVSRNDMLQVAGAIYSRIDVSFSENSIDVTFDAKPKEIEQKTIKDVLKSKTKDYAKGKATDKALDKAVKKKIISQSTKKVLGRSLGVVTKVMKSTELGDESTPADMVDYEAGKTIEAGLNNEGVRNEIIQATENETEKYLQRLYDIENQ